MADDAVENIIYFFDSICKGMEGLKDKYSQQILELESRNEKIEVALKGWTSSTKALIEEKYDQIFGEKYDEDVFESQINSWIVKYKDNSDLILNIKVLQKNIQHMKTTIKTKIVSSDPLCYTNLTDSLISKSKVSKN